MGCSMAATHHGCAHIANACLIGLLLFGLPALTTLTAAPILCLPLDPAATQGSCSCFCHSSLLGHTRGAGHTQAGQVVRGVMFASRYQPSPALGSPFFRLWTGLALGCPPGSNPLQNADAEQEAGPGGHWPQGRCPCPCARLQRAQPQGCAGAGQCDGSGERWLRMSLQFRVRKGKWVGLRLRGAPSLPST